MVTYHTKRKKQNKKNKTAKHTTSTPSTLASIVSSGVVHCIKTVLLNNPSVTSPVSIVSRVSSARTAFNVMLVFDIFQSQIQGVHSSQLQLLHQWLLILPVVLYPNQS